jgi:hypothetical protein
LKYSHTDSIFRVMQCVASSPDCDPVPGSCDQLSQSMHIMSASNTFRLHRVVDVPTGNMRGMIETVLGLVGLWLTGDV